jgi:hypothetical protein
VSLLSFGTSLALTYSVPHAASGGGNQVTQRYYTEYDQLDRIGASVPSANMIYDFIRGPVMSLSLETCAALTKPDASDFK